MTQDESRTKIWWDPTADQRDLGPSGHDWEALAVDGPVRLYYKKGRQGPGNGQRWLVELVCGERTVAAAIVFQSGLLGEVAEKYQKLAQVVCG